jgi:hypothetical protein
MFDNYSDYFSSSDDEGSCLNTEITLMLNEEKYYNDLKIVEFYKDKLKYEPEFIGIKNLNTVLLFDFINDSRYCYEYEHVVISENVHMIFDDLFTELYGECSNVDRYRSIIAKIYKKCYC